MARRSAPPLLLLLLVVLLPLSERSCVASTTTAQQTGAAGPSLPASLVDLLWTTISRVVRSAVGEAASELDGRLSGLQVQLTQLAETLSGLQEAQNVTHQRQLQALETGVASVQSRLESRLEGVQAQVDSRLGDVQSRLEYKLSKIASRLPPRDCSDLPAGTESGIHLLTQAPAFCDQQTDGGGWITFQRREDIKPRQDFFLGWEAYKRGFGALEGEFWWGLEYLYRTTSVLDRRYELRIDMSDFDGEKRFALYQGFRISSEADGYRLHVANYSGDASDSLGGHNGMAFSTKDKDQDNHSPGSCAQTYKGAWWYHNCHQSNLNGLYLGGANTIFGQGINWEHWRGDYYSLKSVEMKMRPAKRTS